METGTLKMGMDTRTVMAMLWAIHVRAVPLENSFRSKMMTLVISKPSGIYILVKTEYGELLITHHIFFKQHETAS